VTIILVIIITSFFYGVIRYFLHWLTIFSRAPFDSCDLFMSPHYMSLGVCFVIWTVEGYMDSYVPVVNDSTSLWTQKCIFRVNGPK
jgi:hypothetical protein